MKHQQSLLDILAAQSQAAAKRVKEEGEAPASIGDGRPPMVAEGTACPTDDHPPAKSPAIEKEAAPPEPLAATVGNDGPGSPRMGEQSGGRWSAAKSKARAASTQKRQHLIGARASQAPFPHAMCPYSGSALVSVCQWHGWP